MSFEISCPLPQEDGKRILLAHGAGGRLSHDLFKEIFLPAFNNTILQQADDAAKGMPRLEEWAVATDAHVVKPLQFPGGNIGKLAVLGATNDLAVAGARPKFVTMNWLLEEGLSIQILRDMVRSAADTARDLGVVIVAGDTKVIERGKADQIFISTTAIGEVLPEWSLGPERISPGDAILVSGDIGRHGLAVLLAREELALKSDIVSDCAPLFPVIEELYKNGIAVQAMRDLTRGGLAAAVWELAHQSGTEFLLTESDLPVTSSVRSACELLGLDPIHIANEGTFLCIVKSEDTSRALAILREFRADAALIGSVGATKSPGVSIARPLGGTRWLILPAGEPMPRIC